MVTTDMVTLGIVARPKIRYHTASYEEVLVEITTTAYGPLSERPLEESATSGSGHFNLIECL